MDNNPAPVPQTPVPEPKGDLGQGHKTWSPEQGEQGISNRPDDETDAMPDGDEESDDDAFNASDDDE